jgi:hypothetical protein
MSENAICAQAILVRSSRWHSTVAGPGAPVQEPEPEMGDGRNNSAIDGFRIRWLFRLPPMYSEMIMGLKRYQQMTHLHL